MLRYLFHFLISRHFLTIILFIVVFGFVSMLDLSPVRTKPCPHIIRTISPAGDLLAGWGGGIVDVYQTGSLEQIASFNHPGAYNVLPGKFSKNSQYLVTTAEATSPEGRQSYPLYIWNLKAQQKPIIILGDGGHQSFAFSSDSTRLVAADDYRGKSSEKTRYTLGIWNVETGERLHELVAGHQGLIIHVDWSPDGTRIATASMDGTVRLWDANTGLETKCLKTDSNEGGYFHTAFTSNGKTVICWSNNQKVISWNVETGSILSTHTLVGNSVEFYRYGLTYDIVCSSCPVQWPRTILKEYDKWLPDWSKNWLQKRGYRTAVYRFDSETGSLNKIMTLRPYTKPLIALSGTEELLAYEATVDPGDFEDGQLTWYSLDQSFAWLRSLTWAAIISLGYWLLLSIFAWWRRSKLKLHSTG